MIEIKKLRSLQDELKSSLSNFPKKACSFTVMNLSNDFNLKPVSGFVLTSQGKEEHSWAEDIQENMIIDLTLHQFSDYKNDDFIYLPKEEAVKKYGYDESDEMTKNLEESILSMNRHYSFRGLY